MADETVKTEEQLRDEKCVPVARGVLIDMAAGLMDANGDFAPMMLKIMQRSLDADLNIVMDNPYVFQLILGTCAGLNATVQACDTMPIDDVRYNMVARKILSILATSNVPMAPADPKGKLDTVKIETDFSAVKEQLNALFKENNLSRIEVNYIMENIFTGFQATQNAFSNVVANYVETATAKVMGLDYASDLTMKKLNDVLVGEVKAPVVVAEHVRSAPKRTSSGLSARGSVTPTRVAKTGPSEKDLYTMPLDQLKHLANGGDPNDF